MGVDRGPDERASQEALARAPAEVDASLAHHGFSLADVRAANRACILAALEREGPLSRSALARHLRLSRTTVSHIVAGLLAEGRVREDGALPASEAGGRRATLLWLCVGGVEDERTR
ncbi:MAG TPA: helix-turn-helix domain-containing protein [Ktedonobacterales bacterium]